MKESSNRKKGVLVGVIAALLLVVTLGVTFAIWNYSRTTDNQILVTGDIYMKYTGTNQINAPGMLPIDINNYYHYVVNSNMTQEELLRCEDYWYMNELPFDDGTTTKSFCEGIGTFQGMTFQKILDSVTSQQVETTMQELTENNVIKKELIPKPVKEYRYIRNESMTSEELSSCESFFNSSGTSFDEGTTAQSFCEGLGTIEGMTFQEMLDNIISSGTPIILIELEFSELIENNIIKKEIAKEYPAIPYFEFKIEGVNDYSKDIWYEIVLKDGEEPEGRSERLRDDLLRFRLVEVVGEEEQEIFTNRGYEDISDEKIYVNTISGGTKEKITRTYRLYMWISDSVKVGVGDNVDYDMETWNNQVYASVKINVTGDFKEKKVVNTPITCFMTQEFDNNGKTEIMITDYDWSCGTDVVIPRTINGHEVTVIGSRSVNENESYIQPMAFSNNEYEMSFSYKGLTSVVIPNTVRIIGAGAFETNNITKVEIPDSVEWIGEGAFVDNSLQEVMISDIIKYIGKNAFGTYLNQNVIGKIQIQKTCEEIKNIPESPTNLKEKPYPFVYSIGQDGLDIYGYEDGAYKLCEHLTRNSY